LPRPVGVRRLALTSAAESCGRPPDRTGRRVPVCRGLPPAVPREEPERLLQHRRDGYELSHGDCEAWV